MQRAALMCLLLLPLAAGAAGPSTQPKEWTQCTSDEECVVVKGMCNPAAVRKEYDAQATAFFVKRANEDQCVKKFWEPAQDKVTARCRLERCEIAT